MELLLSIIILLLAAIVMETIDSGLGMMYGTLLSPILILLGFSPIVVVPSLLISQAIGGFIATYRHHKVKNININLKSIDTKIGVFIFVLGIISVIIGAYIGLKLPKLYLKAYIGTLCVLMGSIVLAKVKFSFSWFKIAGISILSAFNKSISGGGYGPIVASGNVASGLKARQSIGLTDFAEAPICLASFIAWIALNNWILPDVVVFIPLCIGAAIGGFIGPKYLTKTVSTKNKSSLRLLVGFLAVISGVLLLTLGI